MKTIIGDFLDLLGNCLLVLTLMLASFLLLINVYHYQEANYVYNYDIQNNLQYKEFKEKVEKLETNIKKINTDLVIDQGKRMMLKTVEGQLNKCIQTAKESQLYNWNKTSFVGKNLYEFNEELYKSLKNQCIFLVNYNIYNSLETYKIPSKSYTSVKNNVEKKDEDLEKYTEFLRSEMLENSAYNYTTEITRTTVFNKIGRTLELIVNNYDSVLDSTTEMMKWYMVQAGGVYE